MKPPPFEPASPSTIEEAAALLDEHAEDAKVLAGGQSLVPLMNFRLARPKWLVDINGIAALDYVREDGDWLAIGAMVRQREVERSPLVAATCPLLGYVTRWIGHMAIRNRGTVGGSLAHNDPTAEYPLAAVLLGAELRARSRSGERSIPVQDFLVTYLTTALEPNELLTEVRFPRLPAHTGWAFQEFSRRHGDFAIVAVGATVTLEDGRVSEARIAIGGVGPTAFRATRGEAVLSGQAPTEDVLDEAADRVAATTDADGDVHASPAFRAHLARVLTRTVLREAVARAR